jgi:hypothetical protein
VPGWRLLARQRDAHVDNGSPGQVADLLEGQPGGLLGAAAGLEPQLAAGDPDLVEDANVVQVRAGFAAKLSRAGARTFLSTPASSARPAW